MNKKQKLSIAAIAAITALLAALILISGSGANNNAKVAEKNGHDHAAEKNGKDDHGDHKEEHKDEHKNDPKGEHKDDHKDDHTAEKDAKHAHDEGHEHEEENTIAFSDAQLKTAGIRLATAASGVIRTSVQLPGEIRFNEDRTAHVVPKVGGVAESVSANLGQKVKKGQVLAVISSSTVSEQRSELLNAQQRLGLAQNTYAREKKLWEEKISAEQDYLQARQALKEAEIAVSNARQKLAAIGADISAGAAPAGLNRYALRAPFDGIVVEKHLALGEAVKEDTNVFTISDLSQVWAEISVSAKDLQHIRVGESVSIKASAFDATASGKISYVGALLGEQTRTAKAHIVLNNPEQAWRPGMFINVAVLAAEAPVALAISADAVQTIEDKNVVFVRTAEGFKKQEVSLGRNDGKQVEITKGLKAGDIYAAQGSFVIKSELGKGSAEHTH